MNEIEKKLRKEIAEKVYERAMTEKGLLSEKINGCLSQDRIWWIQAEAMVGLMYNYQKTNEEKY